MRVRRTAFVLLALLLGACSTGGKTNTAARRPDANASRPAGASSTTSTPAANASGGTTPAASAGSSMKPVPSASWTPDDFVGITVNRFTGWGCTKRPGDSCLVPIVGSYFLIGSNVGSIILVVHENGSKEPTVSSPPSPVVAGSGQIQTNFSYKIGAGVRTASFGAWLRDDRGVILYKSKLDTFKLNSA